ncbi:cyclase family protein (plasmid) [Halorussus limi]|uniref:Cyclase family protein n=1 Tax=Halorussus limi TaxID=2938695 RepID=A0A8U0I062_9EURY|nr:cyclase family protein [Halorussus limi]UPV76413.1 cyclase family protein [Halorussus limi]
MSDRDRSTADLTQPLDADATVYPGDPAVESAPAATHDSDGYRVTELRFGSHSGTHVDAPSHTEPDGKNLDAFGVEEFVFDAQLVDCTGLGARDPIGPEVIPGPKSGGDAETEMLVLRTGWDAHWGTDRYFDHPYLTAEAAATCADRGWHVGLDALSPDPSPSETGTEEGESTSESVGTGKLTGAEESGEMGASAGTEKPNETEESDGTSEPDGVPAHRELLGSGLFVVENLTGLGEVPDRFELLAYPLALVDADGSPVRAVATW